MSTHTVRRTNRLHAVVSILIGLNSLFSGWAMAKWYDTVLLIAGGLLTALGLALLVHPLAFETRPPGDG